MTNIRPVLRTSMARPTMEGAGVRLQRVFGRADRRLDPFLLLDEFGSDQPEHYLEGFPWHPHRGIETITYMLEGSTAHGDSLGNRGVIGPGDVQWMTAGSGIIHEEMPQRSERLRGFQLWANLPAAQKMMGPRYRDIRAADIPTARLDEGVTAKVICGRAGGSAGPVQDIVINPQYLDVLLEPGASLHHPILPEHNVFAYVFEGEGRFSEPEGPPVSERHLVVFGDGDSVSVVASELGVRFLLVSGKPLGEPVAWGGPIVMNTQEELRLAFEEYEAGTFIKQR